MTSLGPDYSGYRDERGSHSAHGSANVHQAPAGVTTLAEHSTPAQLNSVSFPEKSNGAQEGMRSRSSNNILSRLGHELSHDSIDEKEIAQQEIRPLPHRYFLQRPRALQYTYRGERIGYGEDAAPIQHEISGSSAINYTVEGVAKARERIDLFIDLVWVGIISNLSEVFSEVYFEAEAQSGKAFLMFILVFLPAWRIWNFLREFLNSFYMDDTIQRVFVFWILSLSVFFGNEIAYFAGDYEGVKQTLILTYVIIRVSFVIMELFYAVWIPWMRKLIFLGFVVMLPASALWTGAIFAKGTHAIGPALAAIIWEYCAPMILDTPLGEKLLPSEYRKEIDPIHLRGRMGNFLIITIGEGVLMLIRGGPLGLDFTGATSLGTWSLLIYFLLAYLYFQRDGSVRYIPAVRHRGWRLMIWVSWHIPMFASFITLSAGILWFINRNSNVPIEGEEPVELTDGEFLILRNRALWDIGASISVIMFSFLCLALLDKPLDPPKTTLVNNRWLRLIGRPIYILIIMSILVVDELNGYVYLGVCGLGLSLLTTYELTTSLERPAGFLEPKGLTVLMKKEYRQERPSVEQGPVGIRIAI